MLRNTALLRSHVESQLQGRITSPFTQAGPAAFELVSSGIPEIDAFAGGLPRGALTEIIGAPCSGRMTLLLASLALRSAEGEACALIDIQDTFDPPTAAAAGVVLERLLWVRCRNLDQGLRAADLLMQSGGFGMVAMDLGEVAPKTVRHVPLNVWFRFRRAVEHTPTILLLLTQEPNASCASLVLRLEAEPARWSAAASEHATDPSFTHLLESVPIWPLLVRSRLRSAPAIVLNEGSNEGPFSNDPAPAVRFETKMTWTDFNEREAFAPQAPV